MARRRKQENHVNHDRWLVSYADFITLLFAFFVVMYSISQVNQSKYRVLSESFVQAFNLPSDAKTIVNPQDNINPSRNVIAPIELVKNNPSIVSVEDVPQAKLDSQDQKEENTENNDELLKLSNSVNDKFAKLINDGMIKVTSNEFWLQIELNNSILFPSASAEISIQAQDIFAELAIILNHYNNPIQIEGFTDNIPISNSRYPTNWELSSARASAIVKWLATHGVQPERLAAVGYGEFQPVASNDSEIDRAKNRRVAVMIAKRKMERPKAMKNQFK